MTIRKLFGPFCSTNEFRHDQEMEQNHIDGDEHFGSNHATTESVESQSSAVHPRPSPPTSTKNLDPQSRTVSHDHVSWGSPKSMEHPRQALSKKITDLVDSTESSYHDASEGYHRKRSFEAYQDDGHEQFQDSESKKVGVPGEEAEVIINEKEKEEADEDEEEQNESQQTNRSFSSVISLRHSAIRQEAFHQMLNSLRDDDWHRVPLISVNDGHTLPEVELGGLTKS